MNDPTFTELLAFLKHHYIFGDEDEMRISIYYFATHYHSGQASNLYRAITDADFNPGPIHKLKNEWHSYFMYRDLERHYETGRRN